ncbi:hypothetical protein N665_0318s0011 [Sinapis alba]|nr:hypothetical protein N665_0318s0011 [Sinapis alba]
MANLPQDLAEEVLCRLPMTSLTSVRSTCKAWNALSKDNSFTTKHLGRLAKLAAEAKDEFKLVLMMDYEIHLVSINLDVACMREEGKVISQNCTDQIDVCEVFHCYASLKTTLGSLFGTLTGDKACGSSLSIITFAEYNVYDFTSRSWRVLDVTLDFVIDDHCRVSIGGNTYWFARNKDSGRDQDCCLLCFDYTREIFGPRLPLPPTEWRNANPLALSSVREEQLAILFLRRRRDSLMEIWVTSKIEPNTVSWSSKVFLAVNITNFRFPFSRASFFVDEEKKVAVVFGKYREGLMDPTRNVAYIVGDDGSLEIVPLGNSSYKYCFPRVCSYVPTLVQLS